MIGIDTNVLVRYLIQDHPEQFKLAARILEEECSVETPGFVNLLVLCETAWVLARHYRYDRAAIAKALDYILGTDALRIEASEVAQEAFQHFRDGGADYADCLIALINEQAGCVRTCSFDRTAARDLPQFKLIEAEGTV